MTPSRPGLKSGSLVARRRCGGICCRPRRAGCCRLGGMSQSDRVQPPSARGSDPPTRPRCGGSTSAPALDERRPRPGPGRRSSAAGSPTPRRPGLAEPNAMVLATVDADGAPAARTVLLKGYDERGLRFFTNLGSAKAADLAANPRAALVFPWHPVARQVRVDRAGGASWAATRSRRTSRPGRGTRSWAPGPARSRQVVGSRAELDAALAEVAARFPDGEVPAPPRLGRLPGGAGGVGVLGRPDRPAARPAALPAYGGRLDDRAARARDDSPALTGPGRATTRGPHRGGDVSSTSPRVG